MSTEFINNIVKIKYTDEGYLPYYPYHLISDKEMIDAFIFNDSNMFEDFYPLPCKSLETQYTELKSYIQNACDMYRLGTLDNLPDWIYTYMLGNVVNTESSQKDIHDLLVLLNLDNLYDEFDECIYKSIYKISRSVLGAARTKARYSASDTSSVERPCTMFGEPHVIKYLRLEQVN